MIDPKAYEWSIRTLEDEPRLVIGGALCLRPHELGHVWGYLESEGLQGAAEATLARFTECAEGLTLTPPQDPAELLAEVGRAEAAVRAAEQAGGLDASGCLEGPRCEVG